MRGTLMLHRCVCALVAAVVVGATLPLLGGCDSSQKKRDAPPKEYVVPVGLDPFKIRFRRERDTARVRVSVRDPALVHRQVQRNVGSIYAPADMVQVMKIGEGLVGSAPQLFDRLLTVERPDSTEPGLPRLELDVTSIGGEGILDLSDLQNAVLSSRLQLTLVVRVFGPSGGPIAEEASTRRFERAGVPVNGVDRDSVANPSRLLEEALDEILPRLFASPAFLAALEAARPRSAPPAPVAAAPGPAPARGRVFVLIVGVNDYDDPAIPDLRFAENDARSLYAFFTTDRRSPADADRVQLLLGANATSVAIRRAIREHLEQRAIEKEDVAIFYFAGHGFADASETYLAGRDTTLRDLPETGIGATTLQTYWSRIGAGTKVLVTDACRSGGLAGLRGIGGVALVPAGETTRGTITVAAAGPNELSAEDPALGQGVFTNSLLNGLRGDGDADKDGRVTIGELGRYLRETVPREARRVGGNQVPVVAVPAGAEGLSLTR